MIGAMILTIAYGIKISSVDDPLIALAEASSYSVSQAAVLRVTSLIDAFPVLKYIPKWFPGKYSLFFHIENKFILIFKGGSFKRKAEHWARLGNDMYEIPYAMAQRAIVCPR